MLLGLHLFLQGGQVSEEKNLGRLSRHWENKDEELAVGASLTRLKKPTGSRVTCGCRVAS